MTAMLRVEAVSPGSSVQDTGRPGHLGLGLSRGGTADRLALIEGAALLGQRPDCAVLELTAGRVRLRFEAGARIALTGAPMRAEAEGRRLSWNASHRLGAGARLTLVPEGPGSYAYLHVGGGIGGPVILGSRAAHLGAGLCAPLAPGDAIPLQADPGGPCEMALDPAPRLGGGTLRFVDGPQTALFPVEHLERFENTSFRRGARGNRQGVALETVAPAAPFSAQGQLSLLSETIVPGDIQMTGAGLPYILGPECQTVGGYPRIGTVIPDDLPRAMQAAPGDRLAFKRLTHDEALAVHRSEEAWMRDCRAGLRALRRDPARMTDLLSYGLIGGVTAGDELD